MAGLEDSTRPTAYGAMPMVAAMDAIEREFEYKPKWWALLLSMGHFALAAAASGYLATRNGPEIERVLFWVLCGLSSALAILVGAHAVKRLWLRQRIALTPACLLLPKSLWTSKDAAIAYRSITGLYISSGDYAPWASRTAIDCQAISELPSCKLMRARFLYVIHTSGERRIAAQELPSHAAFEVICGLLTARVRASRAV
jgi:hypothetical protein